MRTHTEVKYLFTAVGGEEMEPVGSQWPIYCWRYLPVPINSASFISCSAVTGKTFAGN